MSWDRYAAGSSKSGNRFSTIGQGSGRGMVQGAQHWKQRALSAAAGADDGHKLAFADFEVHPAQRSDLPAVKLLGQADGLETQGGLGDGLPHGQVVYGVVGATARSRRGAWSGQWLPARGIRELAAASVSNGTAVIRERSDFPSDGRLEQIGVQREFGVGQAGPDVVHPMEWFVEQSQGKQAAGPGVGDDAAGGAFGGMATQADMFDVFPPALEIPGDVARSK